MCIRDWSSDVFSSVLLVVPVDKKVRIVLMSNDVIHSWMIPHFGVKQDAMPGFLRDTWFRAEEIGVYRGQCAELCGKDHAFMPIVVNVVSQEDYEAWAGEQKKALRSEEHTSELQSLMRISYAVFCLKKKKTIRHKETHNL